MLAYQKDDGTYAPWRGERIDGIWYPPTIEEVWDDGHLNALGLYRVQPFVLPSGKQTVGDPVYVRHSDAVIEQYQVVDLVLPVPSTITRKQLILQLFYLGLISGQEAMAAAQTGAVPALIKSQFDLMPEPQKTSAYVTWASMSVCERNNPLFITLSQVTGLTTEQIDNYFRQAATL